jgi:hypothetical protein
MKERFEQFSEPEVIGIVENMYGLQSKVIYRYDRRHKAHVFQFEDQDPNCPTTWGRGVPGEPEEKEQALESVLKKYNLTWVEKES